VNYITQSVRVVSQYLWLKCHLVCEMVNVFIYKISMKWIQCIPETEIKWKGSGPKHRKHVCSTQVSVKVQHRNVPAVVAILTPRGGQNREKWKTDDKREYYKLYLTCRLKMAYMFFILSILVICNIQKPTLGNDMFCTCFKQGLLLTPHCLKHMQNI